MATSARPDATAHAASRNATSPVADAFSMWVTGSPVRPSSFIAFTPSIDVGCDVADEGLVDVGQRDARRRAARPARRRAPGRRRCGPGTARTAPSRPPRRRPRRASRPPPDVCARSCAHATHLPQTSCAHGLEAVDHDVVAVLVGAEDLELELQLHADARSRRGRRRGSPAPAGPRAGRPGRRRRRSTLAFLLANSGTCT